MKNKDFLIEHLSAEHSKAQTMFLVRWIGHDAERLAALLDVFMGDDYRLTQRSAWVVRYVGEQAPYLLEPRLPQLVAMLRKPDVHPAVQRNVLNVFEAIDMPIAVQDELADCCFQYLADPQAAAALRASAITILDKICQRVPELRPELRLLLEEHWEHGPASFRSRARRLLERKGG